MIHSTNRLLEDDDHGYSDNHKFRYYSRRILYAPSHLQYHMLRIEATKDFVLDEPLQGALADMFYGCWFEIPYHGAAILNSLQNRLVPRISNAFKSYIDQHKYVMRYSELATRWSVLVTPTLNTAIHSLRISSDDARQLADKVVIELINTKNLGDIDKLKQTEEAYFAHCMACVDRIGFSLVWFSLAKQNWEFDSRWRNCQQHLEMLKT